MVNRMQFVLVQWLASSVGCAHAFSQVTSTTSLAFVPSSPVGQARAAMVSTTHGRLHCSRLMATSNNNNNNNNKNTNDNDNGDEDELFWDGDMIDLENDEWSFPPTPEKTKSLNKMNKATKKLPPKRKKDKNVLNLFPCDDVVLPGERVDVIVDNIEAVRQAMADHDGRVALGLVMPFSSNTMQSSSNNNKQQQHLLENGFLMGHQGNNKDTSNNNIVLEEGRDSILQVASLCEVTGFTRMTDGSGEWMVSVEGVGRVKIQQVVRAEPVIQIKSKLLTHAPQGSNNNNKQQQVNMTACNDIVDNYLVLLDNIAQLEAQLGRISPPKTSRRNTISESRGTKRVDEPLDNHDDFEFLNHDDEDPEEEDDRFSLKEMYQVSLQSVLINDITLNGLFPTDHLDEDDDDDDDNFDYMHIPPAVDKDNSSLSSSSSKTRSLAMLIAASWAIFGCMDEEDNINIFSYRVRAIDWESLEQRLLLGQFMLREKHLQLRGRLLNRQQQQQEENQRRKQQEEEHQRRGVTNTRTVIVDEGRTTTANNQKQSTLSKAQQRLVEAAFNDEENIFQ